MGLIAPSYHSHLLLWGICPCLLWREIVPHCEIEEGEKGQFEVYRSGELFLSKEDMGRFPTVEDVDDMIDCLDPYSG